MAIIVSVLGAKRNKYGKSGAKALKGGTKYP